jgi:hypothetical protein
MAIYPRLRDPSGAGDTAPTTKTQEPALTAERAAIPAGQAGSAWVLPTPTAPTPAPTANGSTPPPTPTPTPTTNPLSTAPVAQSLTDIQKQQRDNAQSQIDAINKMFDQKVRVEEQAEEERSGQTRLASSLAGLAGSTSGGAAEKKTTDYNKSQVQNIKDQQVAEISAIFAKADERALDIARLENEKYKMEFADWREQMDKITTEAKTEFADLSSKTGYTWEQYQKLDPQGSANLLKQTGYDSGLASLKWNAAKKIGDQIPWQQPVQTAEGLMFYGQDPRSGEIKKTLIPAELNKTFSYQITNDGTLLRFNSGTGDIDQYLGEGVFGNPKTTNFGGSAAWLKNNPVGQTTGLYDLSTYATAPGYSKRVEALVSSMPQFANPNDIQAWIQQTKPDSPVTGQMVYDSASKYGVDPRYILSILQKETQLGTDKSFGSRVGNFGNMGVNDTLAAKINNGTATPQEIAGVTMTPQQSIESVAKWLSNHSLSKKYSPEILAIGDAIISGKQPPVTTGLYGKSADVKAYLADRGFDLAKENLNWNSAQRFATNMNSSQMIRFRGLADSVVNTIDEVKILTNDLKLSGVTALNKAELETYRNAFGNTAMGQKVSQYLAAVNTLKEEFANLANGGYAPTEAAWGLANSQINANYGVDQLTSSLDEIQRLINFRVQAINEQKPYQFGNSTTTSPESSGESGGGSYEDYLKAIGQ